MTPKEVARLLDRYRVTDGDTFHLKEHDPDDRGGLDLSQAEAEALTSAAVLRLSQLQTRLYAADSWSMLAVFQAMDAAGKDSAIKHVMTGVNPQGVQVTSFKHPGPEALEKDYLWRVHAQVPGRGRIGIFNRSHYEEVLICRVHPEILEAQRIPGDCQGKHFWKHRLQDIAAFEHYLARQGMVILKFFLNVSKDEQKRRFLKRIEEPSKNWKFSVADLQERARWDDYQHAYQAAIRGTAAPHAPWFVVPADSKWFTQLIVVQAMVQALEALDLREPAPGVEARAKLLEAKLALEAE